MVRRALAALGVLALVASALLVVWARLGAVAAALDP